jgi:hypothetical protein
MTFQYTQNANKINKTQAELNAELNDLERETFPDLVKYIMCNKDRKIVIITKLPFELSNLIQEADPDFHSDKDCAKRIRNFLDGNTRILVISMEMCNGHDFGDKKGNDKRELILFPTFAYYGYTIQRNIICRVYGRINNKSIPIITQVYKRDKQTFFVSSTSS